MAVGVEGRNRVASRRLFVSTPIFYWQFRRVSPNSGRGAGQFHSQHWATCATTDSWSPATSSKSSMKYGGGMAFAAFHPRFARKCTRIPNKSGLLPLQATETGRNTAPTAKPARDAGGDQKAESPTKYGGGTVLAFSFHPVPPFHPRACASVALGNDPHRVIKLE